MLNIRICSFWLECQVKTRHVLYSYIIYLAICSRKVGSVSFATGAFTMIYKRPNARTKLDNPVFIILAHGARIRTYWVLPKDEGPYSHVTSAPALAADQMQKFFQLLARLNFVAAAAEYRFSQPQSRTICNRQNVITDSRKLEQTPTQTLFLLSAEPMIQ